MTEAGLYLYLFWDRARTEYRRRVDEAVPAARSETPSAAGTGDYGRAPADHAPAHLGQDDEATPAPGPVGLVLDRIVASQPVTPEGGGGAVAHASGDPWPVPPGVLDRVETERLDLATRGWRRSDGTELHFARLSLWHDTVLLQLGAFRDGGTWGDVLSPYREALGWAAETEGYLGGTVVLLTGSGPEGPEAEREMLDHELSEQGLPLRATPLVRTEAGGLYLAQDEPRERWYVLTTSAEDPVVARRRQWFEAVEPRHGLPNFVLGEVARYKLDYEIEEYLKARPRIAELADRLQEEAADFRHLADRLHTELRRGGMGLAQEHEAIKQQHEVLAQASELMRVLTEVKLLRATIEGSVATMEDVARSLAGVTCLWGQDERKAVWVREQMVMDEQRWEAQEAGASAILGNTCAVIEMLRHHRDAIESAWRGVLEQLLAIIATVLTVGGVVAETTDSWQLTLLWMTAAVPAGYLLSSILLPLLRRGVVRRATGE